ncbi:hypothetical protein THASP1DRAFT_23683 [Thamnocephalis sphaerospora]|uniref:SfsA N-terminal OB domain-containing protein n=1 Tax=Thamnocephalis sphaerospora TaxID=78915 RepID=A0A4P9XRZ2_9FUNG|nr:hypothetical protein THASP1DRAFT_23683 [Thamnocephalis sphaerospora]|eukprot:RKP08291.1 hypothetical protein THASP1DRAFT_23683 [Thamnocephalis sphaerospora]
MPAKDFVHTAKKRQRGSQVARPTPNATEVAQETMVRASASPSPLPFAGVTPIAHIPFSAPLIQGIILKRPSRFTMQVRVPDYAEVQVCHCPCTGRIGDLHFENIPCLLSAPAQTKQLHNKGKTSKKQRSTAFTVEAISLDPVTTPSERMHWIGINQVRANRFIEELLAGGHLNQMMDGIVAVDSAPLSVQRERKVGSSKLDFVVNDRIFLEVKASENTNVVVVPPYAYSHFGTLSQVASEREGAVARLLLCFMYDAPLFRRPPATAANTAITSAADLALKSGLQLWQVGVNDCLRSRSKFWSSLTTIQACLRINSEGVSLMRFMQLPNEY